jgi:nitroreductase
MSGIRGRMDGSLLESRRSIRSFTAEKPGREILTRLIEAATLAPSASNKQPWRFFMVDDQALIGALADAVQKAVDGTTPKLMRDFAGAFSDYAGYFVRFRAAPALIVPAFKSLTVLSHLVESALTAEEEKRIGEMELYSGLISTSLAIQNLMLCAHSLGLGTSCMTGPLLAEGELKRLLGIPPAWRIAALIPVGYPAETPASVPRKSAESVMRWVEPKPGAASGEGENESDGKGGGDG